MMRTARAAKAPGQRILEFFASLRGRQLLLLAAGLLPAVALLVYVVVDARREQAERAADDALLLARVVALRQESLIDSTRQLLESLANVPEVLADDPAACNALFARLRRQEPVYNNLGTVTSDGEALCSGVPITRPFNASSHDWFLRARETGTFALGDFRIGEVTGRPAMVAAVPVFDRNRNLRRMVLASLSLDWLEWLVRLIELPAGVAVTLLDGNGTVLAQAPRRDAAVGSMLPEFALIQPYLAAESGTFRLANGDDETRLFGFDRVPGTSLVAVVSWPEAGTLAVLDDAAELLLISLIIAEVLVLAGVFWAGRVLLLRPVEALADAAARLAAGDLTARSGVDHDGSAELGRLAEVFDRMAEQLQERHDQLKRGEARAEARLRDAIESAADAILLWDADDRLVLCNQRYAEFFPATADLMRPGLSFAELCRRWAEYGMRGRAPGQIGGWVEGRRAQRREHTGVPIEWRLEDGRWLMTTDYATAEGGTLTIISDVTARRRAEAEIRESRERLQAAVRASETGTFRWDFSGAEMDGGENFNRLFGFEPLARRHPLREYARRVHPLDRARVARTIKAAVRTGSDLDVEFRVVPPDGHERWLATKAGVFCDVSGRPSYMTGASVDITRRKRAEEQLRTLLAELSHRVKNTLATVQSIAQQTLRRSDSLDGFAAAFTGRIGALADVHSLLLQSEWTSCRLHDVVEQPLTPHRSPDGSNVVLSGPELYLSPRACLCLSMVVHELTTNALKYGALSVPGGKVALSWRIERTDQGPVLDLLWQESGGPPVTPPKEPGFGTTLIERRVPYELQGHAAVEYRPEGLVCRITIPWTAEVRGAPRDAPVRREFMRQLAAG